MHINKNLLSIMLMTSFLSIPFRVASLMLICSAIEAIDSTNTVVDGNTHPEDDTNTTAPQAVIKSSSNLSRKSASASASASAPSFFFPFTGLIQSAKSSLIQSAKSRIGPTTPEPEEQTAILDEEQTAIQTIMTEDKNLLKKISQTIEAIKTRLSKTAQGEIGLKKTELLAKLKESLRLRGSSDTLINQINDKLFTALSKDDTINLDRKIIDVKTIDIIIKNIKNLIMQLKANKKLYQYDDTVDDQIYPKVENLIDTIKQSIEFYSENLESFQLKKLADVQTKNPSQVEIMNEIIDMIGLLKTKNTDYNLDLIGNLRKITRVIKDTKSTKQTIKDIRLTVILIKRIINLIKEAKIEGKDDTYIDTQIEIIKKILELLKINKNQDNDDDLILIDKTIQTILDLNQDNGIIKNAIDLLNLLKEKNMSNENINSIIRLIYNITAQINAKGNLDMLLLGRKMIISVMNIISSFIKKSYF